MGKRSNFKRNKRDFYPTPPEAVAPLIPHLPESRHNRWGVRYAEPCAGDGALIKALNAYGLRCNYAADSMPQQDWITKRGARQWDGRPSTGRIDYIITNPPWDRKVLHPMIEHFSAMYPTWLLFDADWVHTKQSAPFMPYLRKIVSVGRVKWIHDSKMTGKDNCAWHLFDQHDPGVTEFYGRVV